MKTLLRKILFYLTFFISAVSKVYGQQDTTSDSHYDGLSLKDLLDLKIVSVSKNPELWFDAPLSSSVVTKEEIQRTNCTSIMEAMRLVPGVIVREQSNGNYDIHLRGMDNIPPNASFDIASTTTLVMIDNRPIYSYLRGGTFWETLPVDINDVERIEVIRGPAAALYGPNAVNGVINIITRQLKKNGLYIVSNNQAGSNHTFINNASIGYRSKKWSMIASGNYQGRDRSQTSYFEFTRNRWLDHPEYFINFHGDTARNVNTRYPDQNLAMEKYAGNIFINYDAGKKLKFDISTGIQHSDVQKVSAENEVTPLSTAVSDSRYIDFRAVVKRFTGQLSYNSGTQNVDLDPGNKFDFSTLDANIEYNYTKGNFSLKPAVSYRKAVYDDTKYSDTLHKTGIFNDREYLTTKSASLRAEYKLLEEKLRLVAGITINKFNYPDTMYAAYELAATYKSNKNNLFRAVYSMAPRSSNIFDTYVDQSIAFFPTGFNKYQSLILGGNQDLKLFTAHMFEVGYRGIINSRWNIDVELFNIKAKNPNILVTSASYTIVKDQDTIQVMPILATNLPLRAFQQGITVSVNYSSNKIQVKPFVTIQKTKLKDYAPYGNTPDAGMGPNNIYSGMGTVQDHKATPTVFGGASINYVPNSKLNLNLSAYYYSSQTYYHLSNVLFNDGIRGIDHIDAKLILNATASYEAAKGFHIFCSGKNILNDRSREFFRADAVPLRLLTGINYEF